MRDPTQFSKVIKELMPNLKFYWSLQDGVRLTPPFTLLDIINDRILGMGEHQSTVITDDPTEQGGYYTLVSETREVTVRVSTYGTFTDSSYRDARYLEAVLRSFKGRSALFRQGLSLVNVSKLNRVDVSGDTTPYINNYFDITLGYKSIEKIDLDPMEVVEVEHQLTVETDLVNPDGEFTMTGTNTYTR